MQTTVAFEEEAFPHMDDLFRAAVRLLLDQTKAGDAVHKTYLIAWKTFDRYERGTNFRAWLFQILFNVIRHERRKWFRWITAKERDLTEAQLTAPVPIPDTLPDSDILAALDKVPLQLREALLLVDVEEFSYKEASGILKIPIDTILSRLSRARAMLRNEIAAVARPYGVSTASA